MQGERVSNKQVNAAGISAEKSDSAALASRPWWPGGQLLQNLPAIFLVLGLPLGLVYATLTPPFQVPDEPAHFYRSFAISQGSCISPAQQTIPHTIHQLVLSFPNRVENEHAVRFGQYERLMKANWRQGGTVGIMNPNASVYSCVPYLASAFGMELAKLASQPAVILLYWSRLGNLVAYLALGYLAIRIIPVGRLVLFCLGLMPMSLHLAGSVSADAITISSAFLLIAYILYLALDSRIPFVSVRHLMVLSLLLLLVTLCKFNPWYVLLVLIVPEGKFGGRKRELISAGAMLGVVLMVSAAWQLVDRANVAVFQAVRASLGIYVGENFRYISANPGEFLAAVGRSFQLFWRDYAREFVGFFGWLSVPLPYWIVGLYLAMLVITGVASGEKAKLTARDRMICVAVVAGSVISTFALLWAFETSRTYLATQIITHKGGSPGIQGRYFIPLVPLVLLVASNSKIRMNSQWLAGGCAAVILLSSGVAYAALRETYYYGSSEQTAQAALYKDGGWLLDAGNHRFDPGQGGTPFGGLPGDIPVMGDWNGDGRRKIGIYRHGTWMLDWDGDAEFTKADHVYNFGGTPDDLPVIGDWTGDGRAKIGVYRGGEWILDTNGNGKFEESTDAVLWFGGPGDLPAVGNWSGGKKTNLGVYRKGLWLLDSNGNGRWDGPDSPLPDLIIHFGSAGDVPVPGDWKGDGRTRLGFVRDGSQWFLDTADSRPGGTEVPSFNFGTKDYLPIVGPWSPAY